MDTCKRCGDERICMACYIEKHPGFGITPLQRIVGVPLPTRRFYLRVRFDRVVLLDSFDSALQIIWLKTGEVTPYHQLSTFTTHRTVMQSYKWAKAARAAWETPDA